MFKSQTIPFSNLIIGLGNPGKQYYHTRHNIGFRVVDYFLQRYPEPSAQHLCQSIVWQREFDQKLVMIAKPLTFMNRSGLAVSQLANRYNISTDRILIVYDDLNLVLGHLRCRGSGRSGGHNGIKSIIDHLGTEDFSRLRVGIGLPEDGSFIDHVLGNFSPEEDLQLDTLVSRSVDAIESYLKNGLSATMNQFNIKNK